MADQPWTDDLAALGDRTRRGLRSLESTRALLAAGHLPAKETQMSLFRRRPALAAAITVLVLAILAPVAYAFVNRVLLSIDPDESEPEIEQKVKDQLEAAGYNPTTVKADKSHGQLMLRIEGDEALGQVPIEVQTPNGDSAVDHGTLNMQISVDCELDDAQLARLNATATTPAFLALIYDRPANQSDADMAKAITKALADAGFHGARVEVRGKTVDIKITQPPS